MSNTDSAFLAVIEWWWWWWVVFSLSPFLYNLLSKEASFPFTFAQFFYFSYPCAYNSATLLPNPYFETSSTPSLLGIILLHFIFFPFSPFPPNSFFALFFLLFVFLYFVLHFAGPP